MKKKRSILLSLRRFFWRWRN